MKIMRRVLSAFYSVYAFILFVVIMLLIFPFVILASFFGRIKGGNWIFRLCMFWADCWFFLIFVPIRRIYESPHDKTKPYIFLTNHISYLDAATLPKAYRQPVRPLGKVEMSKIPLFGFIYKNSIVAVDRSSASNRSKSVRILRSVLSKGISILVFPEGTFNMGRTPLKEFYDGAFRLAIETQTPLKPVLFLDNYRRMPYENVLRMTPGQSRIVYLEEIPVKGLTSADAKKLKEKVYEIMEKKLVEYNAAYRQTGAV